MANTVKWAVVPSPDDLAKAAWYLTLLDVPTPVVDSAAGRAFYAAKDLLRTAQLPALARDNAGVRKWLDRLAKAEIPPVLLMRGSLAGGGRALTIAEGYHRVCACYWLDEKTPVACFFLTGTDVR